jgi:hypothetical protein
MPDRGPATPLLAPTTDDLDAQCRGIGTLAAPPAASPAGAAYRTGPVAAAGVLADVPGAPHVAGGR